MKTLLMLLLGAAGAFFAGCATPFRPPADVAHVKLATSDAESTTVMLSKIWLERKDGPLVVTGYAVKRLDAKDTTQTHLDVILSNAAGQVLRRTVDHFEPRQIPRRYRRPDYATYRVALDPLPTGTARIEVRAHEGECRDLSPTSAPRE